MLYGPDGRAVAVRAVAARPEPQPDAEARVRVMLKSIDELLDVKWFPFAIWNERNRSSEGRYGLIVGWPQMDPRWEMYQTGEVETPYDLLGWFCEDIHDATSMPVGVDSIENKVIELLAKCDGRRLPHTTRMRQIVEKNAKMRKEKRSEVSDQAEDVARTLWNIVGKHDDAMVERIMKEISGE